MSESHSPTAPHNPLLHHLNAAQMAAVVAQGESVLVLAGAGSGKTRVLTTRIAWLIQTRQCSPGGLLAVTFTNKAAKEMVTRLSTMLPINLRGMWLGTFHGLCNRFLRAHFRDANLPQTFQILDSADQLSAIKRLYKAQGVDDERYPPKQCASFINSAKEQGLRPNAVEANDHFSRKFAALYADYEVQCEREGVVDFAELLLRTFEILRDNLALRAHYQSRFRHILIDEFQDTNRLQYEWLKLLAGIAPYQLPNGTPAAVMAVGDDDQSIYAFRGARVENMAAFEREFNVQSRIKLEQNYRSVSHILDSANALIARNSNRLGKDLWTDAGEGDKVRIYEAHSDGDEAQYIVDEIKQRHNAGLELHHIALLYRSNAQSRILEHGLMQAKLPYKVYGGLRFFERLEIKHCLAYLRLVENPNDDTAFLRIVNFPPRGIGARTLENLQADATARQSSLYAAAPHMDGASGAKLASFVRLIETIRFESSGLPLAEIVEHTLARTGLIEHFQNDKAEKDKAQERVENLKELISAAASFNLNEGYGTDAAGTAAEQEAQIASPLAAFLSHASLEAGDNQAQNGQHAVQLMTIHSAKGLEFDTVFITGVEEGLFPHENSASDDDGLEEERRLMYVAITRAQKHLTLTFAASRMLHGQTRYSLKSRFFDELPDAHLKWLTPKNSGYHAFAAGANKPAFQSGWSEAGDIAAMRSAWNSVDSGGAARRDADKIAQKMAQSNPNLTGGYHVGQNVYHAKFGDGTVTKIEGRGADLRAQINFRDAGYKWLALAVAKLEKR